MERMIYRPHVRHMGLPGIRLVSLESPFCWLRQGRTDLRRNWPVSLAFGVVFAALGYLLVNARTWPHLALSLTSRFLLVAPRCSRSAWCTADDARRINTNIATALVTSLRAAARCCNPA